MNLVAYPNLIIKAVHIIPIRIIPVNCPFLSLASRNLIDGVVNSLPYMGTGNRNCADIALDVFVD